MFGLMKKLNVVLVGLGFGAAFAPIYTEHPDVASLGIFDPKKPLTLNATARLGNVRIYDSFEEVLNDSAVDAVHLVSPIPEHAKQTVAVLNAGKHCGSHPHMVHEFIRSILENRKPWVNEINGANIVAVGICAHESAMKGGEIREVPEF